MTRRRGGGADDGDEAATAVTSISDGEAEILMSLYQHRMLSTRQVHDLHLAHASDRWARKVLERLRARRWVDDVAMRTRSRQSVWFVTAEGARAAEAGGVRARPYRTTARLAAGPLQAHTLAVNDVGIAFARAAAGARGHDFGPFSWYHEEAFRIADRPARGKGSDLVVADATLHYVVRRSGGAVEAWDWLVELDRSTEPLQTLLGKVRRYLAFSSYVPAPRRGSRDTPQQPAWRGHFGFGARRFPGVVVVLAAAAPEAVLRRRMIQLLELCHADASLRHVDVAVALLPWLVAEGPLRHVFHRVGSTTRFDVFAQPAPQAAPAAPATPPPAPVVAAAAAVPAAGGVVARRTA